MNITEVNEIWANVKAVLEKNLPEHIFSLWVKPLEAANYENNSLVLLSPQQLSVDILKKDWSEIIKNSVKEVLGENASYSLRYDPDLADKYIKAKKKDLAKRIPGQTEEEKQQEDAKQHLAQMQSGANLNLNLKFENFVVGENSKFAYNAAYSVANNPSKKFNPLFIYGASGLGKTHLLQAIGHYVIFNTKLKVRYIRMEEYFNEWVRCFQHNDTPGKKYQTCNNVQMRKFHQKFENIDILLMDDIQFIESKMKTMEDFFSTFEALYTNNKQIVIASDRLPRDIPKLDNRLRTRFEMGLVVDIQPPAFETRFEIVKAYSKETDTQTPDEVCEYIAKYFENNVRELKGAFNKVSAFAEFSGEKITLALAKKVLKCEENQKKLTISDIANIISKEYDIDVKDLKSSARQQKIASARHVAVYFAREILNMSYESIGDYFEKKHTTIMYSHDTVKEKIEQDNEYRKKIENIEKLIRG